MSEVHPKFITKALSRDIQHLGELKTGPSTQGPHGGMSGGSETEIDIDRLCSIRGETGFASCRPHFFAFATLDRLPDCSPSAFSPRMVRTMIMTAN